MLIMMYGIKGLLAPALTVAALAGSGCTDKAPAPASTEPTAPITTTYTSPATPEATSEPTIEQAGRIVLKNAASIDGDPKIASLAVRSYAAFKTRDPSGHVTANFFVNTTKTKIKEKLLKANVQFLETVSTRFGRSETEVITPQGHVSATYQPRLFPARQRSFIILGKDEVIKGRGNGGKPDTQTFTLAVGAAGDDAAETVSFVHADPNDNRYMPGVPQTEVRLNTELIQSVYNMIATPPAATQIVKEAFANGIGPAMAAAQNGRPLRTVQKAFGSYAVKRGGYTAHYLLPPQVLVDQFPEGP